MKMIEGGAFPPYPEVSTNIPGQTPVPTGTSRRISAKSFKAGLRPWAKDVLWPFCRALLFLGGLCQLCVLAINIKTLLGITFLDTYAPHSWILFGGTFNQTMDDILVGGVILVPTIAAVGLSYLSGWLLMDSICRKGDQRLSAEASKHQDEVPSA